MTKQTTQTTDTSSMQEETKLVCLHDKYVSEEMSGKLPDYLLQRMVSICADCEQNISHLRLFRR